MSKFNVGDEVRVLDNSDGNEEFFSVGEVGKVVDHAYGHLIVDFPQQNAWWYVNEDKVERINAVNGIGPAGKSPRDYLRERMENNDA